MIEIQGLTRWFGTTCAVDELSFEVPAGDVIGFIGPNGAGKTTTLRILATLDEPDFGDARVDGFSVINDPDRVRCRIGFVPDQYGSYPNVSCIEYLDFFARSYGLTGKARIRAINRVIDFTQMRPMLHKPMSGLSKGMKQRLCLGRALVHDPQVLILDEPAAGLDPRARIELKGMIGELAAAGKSLLISSHILSELAEMCDRVAIIERGRLLAEGTVEDILLQHATSLDPGATRLIDVTATVLERGAELVGQLSDRGYAILSQQGNTCEFQMPDDPAAQADLVQHLVSAGFRLNRFAPKPRSLEEAFLKVTRGNRP